ncbi:MAG TPA: Rieske 2Fe-2S domain-containing protein [Acidimicrobiia bacterium]|nr:Rieske 2Fe-2S domain-containing protein [Acidimicrobiia bacterium]
MRQGWPYTRHPSGWFQIGWSAEIGVGDVRPLRYFDTDLVAYRGRSGILAVLDAHCPHLGADLGHGGCVEDDTIVCPFHAWRWDAEGRNTNIPYSTTVNRRQRIRTWPVREIDGLVHVWYDADGAGPAWEPEPISAFVAHFDPAEFHPVYPVGTHTFAGVRAYPQFITENFVDAAHFLYVHSARAVTTIDRFSAHGPFFDVEHRFAGGRDAGLSIRAFGLGMAVGVFRAGGEVTFLEIQATTPIDAEHSDLRGSVFARRTADDVDGRPCAATRSLIERQHTELGKDIPIWERLHYVARAPFAPEEARPYRALRRWATQFYGPEGETVAAAAADDDALALVAE